VRLVKRATWLAAARSSEIIRAVVEAFRDHDSPTTLKIGWEP
jgi:hypothetical protein